MKKNGGIKIMGRLAEIETRKAEIKGLLESDEKDLNLVELRAEIDSLNAEKAQIEERKQIAEGLNTGSIIPDKVIEKQPKMEERKMFGVDTKEYRSAWLKNLMGTATEEEKRSVVAANSVIAVDTYNAIFSKVKQYASILDEITLLNVAGNVSFGVEGTNNDADVHTENGGLDGAADTWVTVSLGGYEIVKLVRISATVKTMSVNAFEGWLVDNLAEKVAAKIEYYVINGTGNSQPKGIDKAQTWSDGTNAVDWAADNAPTAAEIGKLISYLPGGATRNAKFLINHKTFWQQVMKLRDDAKAPIVSNDNGSYRIYGFPVLFSDMVVDGDIFLGNFKQVVGNLSQNVTVESSTASGFLANSIDYRGVCIFDADIADGTQIVKGATTL